MARSLGDVDEMLLSPRRKPTVTPATARTERESSQEEKAGAQEDTQTQEREGFQRRGSAGPHATGKSSRTDLRGCGGFSPWGTLSTVREKAHERCGGRRPRNNRTQEGEAETEDRLSRRLAVPAKEKGSVRWLFKKICFALKTVLGVFII